jgi:minor histocompatibility antigen H13
MTAKDAYMFPVVGSCVLCGLYVLFKFLNKDYVNMLLKAYIFCLGVFAMAGVVKPAVMTVVSKVPFLYVSTVSQKDSHPSKRSLTR